MSEATKVAITNSNTWMRIVYMVLFGFVYSIAEVVMIAIAVVQVLFKLSTGEVNQNLLALGKQVVKYIYNIMQFLTFSTDEKPFPFSTWQDSSK
ncbi:MAG: Possible lipase [uncultured Thiotrichaceae bacterium]|uniref:Possible lipase n=1 Tax=uncultured Thiotrichaceae bacterium TaxID=298394 RepID=A0A6S6SIG5_9GAMM|nr:MAG: Possible lipase [uncultured Thiotrichaceae bacterium]